MMIFVLAKHFVNFVHDDGNQLIADLGLVV
jgi:hypothetical protein